jgi:hypothetical protein
VSTLSCVTLLDTIMMSSRMGTPATATFKAQSEFSIGQRRFGKRNICMGFVRLVVKFCSLPYVLCANLKKSLF